MRLPEFTADASLPVSQAISSKTYKPYHHFQAQSGVVPSSQYCYCEENNFACNPSNPWPGCTCKCVNI
jgi:hypothetical protein